MARHTGGQVHSYGVGSERRRMTQQRRSPVMAAALAAALAVTGCAIPHDAEAPAESPAGTPSAPTSARAGTAAAGSDSGIVRTGRRAAALPDYRVGSDALRRVPDAKRPYAASGIFPLQAPGRAHDDSGVVMFKRDGRLYNHPVLQAQHAFELVSSYRNGGGQAHLDLAVKHAERILSYGTRRRGALYFPYAFDFPLHGKTAETLRAPWYSAMAQGEALSLFVALYEITGGQRWRTRADEVFQSFLNPREAGSPWTVTVDDKGYLWFEEYPGEQPDRAYNGHNFALLGVYDYWHLTQDERVARVFRGGLQASRHYASTIRVPGGTSRYCLKHPEVHSSGYHATHIWQLYTLYRLTGSSDLARLADQLQADAPAAYSGGRGWLAAGTHTVVTRRTTGTARAVATTRLSAPENVTVGERKWVTGRPGVWLRIDSGSLRGRWVQELPGRSFVRGRRAVARLNAGSASVANRAGTRSPSSRPEPGSSRPARTPDTTWRPAARRPAARCACASRRVPVSPGASLLTAAPIC